MRAAVVGQSALAAGRMAAYTRDGDSCDIPSHLPGSAYYSTPDATAEQAAAAAAGCAPRARGFKCVGTFKGDADWCTEQLEAKLVKKLRPMDHLDLLNDSAGCQATASHRRQLHKEVAATLPAYFARAMSPSRPPSRALASATPRRACVSRTRSLAAPTR